MIGVEQLVQQLRLLGWNDRCIDLDLRREMTAAVALSRLDRDRLAFEEGHDLGLGPAADDDVDLMLQRGNDVLDVGRTLRAPIEFRHVMPPNSRR